MSGIRLVSTLAVMGAMQELITRYKAAGSPISADFAPTVALLERLRAGEAADIAILTAQGIDDLIAEGIIEPGTRTDIAPIFRRGGGQSGRPQARHHDGRTIQGHASEGRHRRLFEDRRQRHLLRRVARSPGHCRRPSGA